MEPYQKIYKEFFASFNKQPVSGAEAGELVVKLADYYSEYNLKLIEAMRKFNQIKKACSEQTDGNDKMVSVAKAEMMADATPEAAAFELARAHVQNLDQMISAVKSLQKGLINEYVRT